MMLSYRLRGIHLWPMALLGFSSGLPLALTSSTLQAWYTVSGISLAGIGLLNLIGQPYAYKFLWAPLMDRYGFPFIGRRRGWILVTQISLLITIAIMAFGDPKTSPISLAALALLVAFLSASQDISLDAYRTDILSVHERGLGSALWVSGYRLAMLTSGGVALVLAEFYGWKFTFLLMSALMLIGMIPIWLTKNPLQNDNNPVYFKQTLSEAFIDLWNRPYIILTLAFIVLYKLSDAFALSLNTAFYLRGLGFTLTEIGLTIKSVALVSTLFGMFVAGFWMLRIGLYRSLWIFGLLQASANLIFITLVIVGKNYTLFILSIFIENLTSGMGSTAFLAFLMGLCNERYTATQLALLTSLMAIGRIFVGPLAAHVVQAWGWLIFFTAALFVGGPGLFILYFLKRRGLNFEAEKINSLLRKV